MLDVQDYLKLPKLGMDDKFEFSCNGCGKCCRNREDILLTPLDLFKIAKFLNKPIKDVMGDYCEFYEGQTSKVPVVRIKPKTYQKTCPFLKQSRCQLHPTFKPAVCAIFPLGRMTEFKSGEFNYFLQPAKCGGLKQSQTVREYLSEFPILEEEEIAIMWQKKLGEMSMIMRETYEKANFNHEDITIILFLTLYVKYDLERDFLPQFLANCEEALAIVRTFATIKNEN